MTTLMVQLDDGLTVPLRECDWVFYHPCGCPRGCMSAVCASWTITDEDAAFREFFDEGRKRETEATIKRERKAGTTARLIAGKELREFLDRLKDRCPHVLAAAVPADTREGNEA